jgi:adenine-specific DNA methylase
MKFKSDQSYDKLRGGYYTPKPVAAFLTRWALAAGATSLLEPSCGDGVFLESALENPYPPALIHGVELDPQEAALAQNVLGQPAEKRRVYPMDYLQFAVELDLAVKYEAVTGNPPYIRYQFLEPLMQDRAQAMYKRHGLAFTKHMNAWVPFVIDGIDRLTPGGRLAMIIPSELLNVIHAGALREFLLRECSKILVIDPLELMFTDALQGTVLLLAEKRAEQRTDEALLSIRYEPDNAFLERDPEEMFRNASFHHRTPSADKWMNALLTLEEEEVYQRAMTLETVHKFSEVANVEVGIVTGANNFFLVADSVVEKYELNSFVSPMFGRSSHCSGVMYSAYNHADNASTGLPVNFVQFGSTPFDDLPKGAQRYIKEGEAEGLHLRYKCRIRSPWYKVPSVWAAPLSLLKRSHELPRLILNEHEAYTTDTAYRVTSKRSHVDLAACFVNSLTALSAEMAGRGYGGGVLELVPSEIRTLAVPLVASSREDLDRLDRDLRAGTPMETIITQQDARVLGDAGMSEADIQIIQRARRRLRARRLRENLDRDPNQLQSAS